MKTLLIVSHMPSPNTQRLLTAVVKGATSPEVDGISVISKPALEAGPEDVLKADAILLGTTENLGYMSGGLKDFFDRTYYGVIEKTDALPYAAFIRAGLDGTGTKRAIASITSGLAWKPVQETVIFHGKWDDNFVERAEELGLYMAAGLESGIF